MHVMKAEWRPTILGLKNNTSWYTWTYLWSARIVRDTLLLHPSRDTVMERGV
jgi:hypothetical protein